MRTFTTVINQSGGRFSSQRGLAVLFTTILFAALLAVSAAAPAGADDHTGSISGTVTDAMTGNPIEGVEVRAYDTAYFVDPHTAITAADGTYAIVGLVGGFTIYFDGLDEYAFEWYNDSPTEDGSTRVVVIPSDEPPVVDAELERAGSIAGTVTTDLASPVSGATVFVYQGGEVVLPKPDPNAPLGVITDPDGVYVLNGLTPGIYTVRISAFGFPDQWAPGVLDIDSANQVEVTSGVTRTDVDFNLVDVRGEINGVVEQIGDLGDDQIWVQTYQRELLVDERPVELGEFRIPNLSAGTYTLGFAVQDPTTNLLGEPVEWYEDASDQASATPIFVGDGEIVDGIEVTLGAEEGPGDDGPTVFFSTSRRGRVDGLKYGVEDIVGFDPVSGEYSLYFDGSEAGLDRNLDAFALLDDGSVLVSFDQRIKIGALGWIDDSDIVRFGPDGADPELFLDGSDVGLTANNEDINSIAVAPDRRLVVSTNGRAYANGTRFAAQDLMVLDDAVYGSDSGGTWSVYLDGSDQSLQKGTERINAASIDPAGTVSLVTMGRFNVPGARGTSNDVFTCDGVIGLDGALGDCAFEVTFRDLINRPVDGLHIGSPTTLAG